MATAIASGAAAICPCCGHAGTDAFCGQCGTEIATGAAFAREPRPEKTTKQALRIMFAPVFEYFEHAPGLIRPARLVAHIREHRFTGIDVTGLWVAAAVLAALAGAFFPTGIKRIEIPMLVEAIEASFVMGLTLVIYAPLHLFLRGRARSATFREFVLVTLATAGLLYPWIGLAQGIAITLKIKPGNYNIWSFPVSVIFYTRAYVALFGRRWVTTVGLFALYFLVALLTTIAITLANDFVRGEGMFRPTAAHAAAR